MKSTATQSTAKSTAAATKSTAAATAIKSTTKSTATKSTTSATMLRLKTKPSKPLYNNAYSKVLMAVPVQEPEVLMAVPITEETKLPVKRAKTPDERAQYRLKRKLDNRMSAKKSREIRKQHTNVLQYTLEQAHQQISNLSEQLSAVMAANQLLTAGCQDLQVENNRLSTENLCLMQQLSSSGTLAVDPAAGTEWADFVIDPIE